MQEGMVRLTAFGRKQPGYYFDEIEIYPGVVRARGERVPLPPTAAWSHFAQGLFTAGLDGDPRARDAESGGGHTYGTDAGAVEKCVSFDIAQSLFDELSR